MDASDFLCEKLHSWYTFQEFIYLESIAKSLDCLARSATYKSWLELFKNSPMKPCIVALGARGNMPRFMEMQFLITLITDQYA